MEPGEESPRAIARATKVPMTPRKVRRVVDLIRGLPVHDALSLLRFAPQAASRPVYKVVESAAANAENNIGLDPDLLVVSKAYVDDGGRPRLGPRYGIRMRAQGRAYRIHNRTSHITIEVESRPRAEVAKKGRRSGVKAMTSQKRSAR